MRQTFPNGRAPRSLLLHGIYDPMPLEAARETAALLSTGVIELATGHAPHVEATEALARALDGFLPPHRAVKLTEHAWANKPSSRRAGDRQNETPADEALRRPKRNTPG